MGRYNNIKDQMTSISERKALAFFATLPLPVVPSQTFAPLPIHHRDYAGATHEGRPDGLCTQPRTRINVESKCGKRLNAHTTKASCYDALQREYVHCMHDGRDHPYNFYTAYFLKRDPVFLQENAWNNSIWKLLAQQALYSWESFIVCFEKNPPAAEATVNKMLGIIELAAHGLYFPFRLDAHRSGYLAHFDPTPDPAHAGLSPVELTAARRATYEASVAAHLVAKQAQHAASLAMWCPRLAAINAAKQTH
jgi:hypothetical protein